MSRWVIALLVLIFSFAAGLSYGWFVAPVEYVDTTPASLRADFQADYVLMVAERFQADRDLDGARRRLSIFGAESPADICSRAIAFARFAAYAPPDLELLQGLHRALQLPSSGATPVGTAP
jgi:hypothetical protein